MLRTRFTVASLLKSWFAKRSRPIRRSPLHAEMLECRDVPAAFTWVPTDPGTFDWGAAANWTGGAAGTVPNDPADTASITSALTGDQTVFVNGAFTFDTLDIGATGGGGVFALGFALDGPTAGTNYGQLVANAITLTEAELALSVGFTAAPGTSFTLIDTANGVTGTFAGLGEFATFTANSQLFRITYQGGTDGKDVVLTRIEAPAFTSPASTTFFTGMNNSFTLTASGFPAPTFSLATGLLPAGVTLTSAGLLSGIPTATGTFTLGINAVNGVGAAANQTFTLTLETGVAPNINSVNNAAFVVGTGGTFTFTAAGAPDPTWDLSAGTLPAGTSLNATTGVLTVGPTAVAGTYSFNVRASNPLGTSTQPFTLTLGTPPNITSAASTIFYTGAFNSFQYTATGAPDPTYSRTGNLPNGITLLTNGILSGTTFQTGTFPLTITAANGIGTPDTQNFTLTVQTGVQPGFSSAGVASFTPGVGGTFQVTATGNPTPTLAQTAGLPTGVTFNAATGLLTVGASTPAGRYTLTFTATSLMGQATQTFSLDITTPPAFTSPNTVTLPGGIGGTFTVTATGAPTPTLTQTAVLPAGVTFNAATGLLTVASTTAAGNYALSFTAGNVAGTATQGFVLRVVAPTLTLVPATLPAGVIGDLYGQQFTAVGGTAPLTFSIIAGGLPPGLTLSAAGLLSGTPTLAGSYGFTVQALDANPGGALVGTRAYTITVGAAPPPVAPLPTRLAVSGATGGGASVFDPNAAGQYPTTATAAVNPFAGLGVVVRTAVGDVDRDGTPDTIFVTGPGTPVRFAVVSGVNNTTVIVSPTAPFTGSESFAGGGFVSTGDIDGDGRAEIVVSPDQGGGPRVTFFSLLPAGLTVRANFLGIDDPNFRGGARTAVGDTNNDGTPDLAVAAGFLGGPRTALFDGDTIFGSPTRLVNDFFAFPGSDSVSLRNGSFVAIGDINGDGFGDLIFGGGPGGAPRVFVLSGQLVTAGAINAAYAAPIANFFVAGNTSDRGGVRVGTVDADADGRADLAVGSGERIPANVRIYLGVNFTTTSEPTTVQSLTVFGGAALLDGVYVS